MTLRSMPVDVSFLPDHVRVVGMRRGIFATLLPDHSVAFCSRRVAYDVPATEQQLLHFNIIYKNG